MSTEPARALPPPEVASSKPEKPEDDRHQSLLEHLGELRTRLRAAVLGSLVGIAVCVYFGQEIFWWVMQPVLRALPEGQKELVNMGVAQPFFVYLRVGVYSGLAASAPWILYQLWLFISPGLYRREKKLVLPFVTLGTLFFVAGIAFAYNVILPYALEYLVTGFAHPNLRIMPDMSQNLTLVLTMLLAFGAIFELPLVMTLLAQIGIANSAFLTKYRRHAVVANVVVAALVTPTGDPLNLALMAGPLMVCYELGIIGVKLVERRKRALQPEGSPPLA